MGTGQQIVSQLHETIDQIKQGDLITADYVSPGFSGHVTGIAQVDPGSKKVAVLANGWMHVEHLRFMEGDLNQHLINVYRL